jgi:hypothetical protein
MTWEISDAETRASFEVVRVDDLPPVDREDINVVPSADRACGCYWCESDWQSIAAASVAILDEGIDPLDYEAIESRALALGLDSVARGWLHTLFSPVDAIIVLRGGREFTNGMHRTHALRLAGVGRCVVYTGRGELPLS